MKKSICKRPAKLGDIIMGGEKYLFCIPITAVTEKLILEQVREAAAIDADMIEWRIDFWEFFPDAEKAVELLKKVSLAAGKMAILVTPRSKREMEPEADDISNEEKLRLIYGLADTGMVHAFDCEYILGEDILCHVSEELHRRGCKLLISRHEEFSKRCCEEKKDVLQNMQAWGADIAKYCVFTESFEEFFNYISLIKEARETYMDIPMVTAVEKMGISRALGDVWGTDMIFVSIDGKKQPGLKELKAFRKMIWPEE